MARKFLKMKHNFKKTLLFLNDLKNEDTHPLL